MSSLAGWERYLGWEMYIDNAFGHFYDTFNIRLKLRGWINWESNDAEHDLQKLLSEAIDETGFVSGETTYNGYVIDVLLVFCGHLTLFDQSGWSYPPWKALIIHWWPNYPKTQTLMHEFSHQFMAEHCSGINSCVMAMADSWYWPAQWCSTCQATINENSDRFWRWVETATGGGAGGGCTLEGTEPEL